MNQEQIYNETIELFKELMVPNNKFRDIEVCLIACSVSKVEGEKIDTIGDKDIGDIICKALWENKPQNMNFAIQCCEHLNKALIIERSLGKRLNLEEVFVIPKDTAGGTFASVAYEYFEEPIIVENIKADAGLDIGLNLIGMNLKNTAQPLAVETEYIGHARVVAARTRLKLIGGERAIYNYNRRDR